MLFTTIPFLTILHTEMGKTTVSFELLLKSCRSQLLTFLGRHPLDSFWHQDFIEALEHWASAYGVICSNEIIACAFFC